MTPENIFKPYKVVSQSKRSLHLDSATSKSTTLFILRITPIIILVIGIVLAIVGGETLYIFLFSAIAIFIFFILLILKNPVSLQLDKTTAVVENLSIAGMSESTILWQEVDRIQYRIGRTKSSKILTYEAVFNDDRKQKLLSFSNYASKKDDIPKINEILFEISNKEVVKV